MSEKTKFWKKSWDDGITDFDPELWETTYIDAIRPTFENFLNKMAFEFLGIEITFGELDKYSNQFANFLIDSGFQKGDIVGHNLPNTPQFMIAWLGTLKAGCVFSGVSPLLSSEQMQYQLSDLGSGGKKVGIVTLDAIFEHRLKEIAPKLPQLELIITTNIADFLPKFKQVLGKLLKKIPTGKVIPLEGKKVVNFMDILKNYSTELPDVELTPDDLAYIIYTGGTTGPPKGAMITHRSAVADLTIVMRWLNWEENRGGGTALSGFPLFHIAGLFFCENCVFLGWSQILVPDPRDTNLIVKKIEKYKPTALVNVPSLFQMLIKHPKFKKLDHSELDVCISSASPFPLESKKELESIVGEGKLLEVYGMTETSPLSVMNPYRGTRKLGSIGLPLPNCDIKLVDPVTGKEVGIGEPGEICVKGAMVMIGYLNKPEETKMAIDGDGYMHSGDVGIFDKEGYLRIVDRTKDMIIVGGFKVFSTKLEDVLTAHPAIEMIATIGIPNLDRPGSELVKAYIQIDPDYSYDGNEEALKEDIIKFAKEKCAPYEVPKIIEFTEELPLTLVGKVDKKRLRKEARG